MSNKRETSAQRVEEEKHRATKLYFYLALIVIINFLCLTRCPQCLQHWLGKWRSTIPPAAARWVTQLLINTSCLTPPPWFNFTTFPLQMTSHTTSLGRYQQGESLRNQGALEAQGAQGAQGMVSAWFTSKRPNLISKWAYVTFELKNWKLDNQQWTLI